MVKRFIIKEQGMLETDEVTGTKSVDRKKIGQNKTNKAVYHLWTVRHQGQYGEDTDTFLSLKEVDEGNYILKFGGKCLKVSLGDLGHLFDFLHLFNKVESDESKARGYDVGCFSPCKLVEERLIGTVEDVREALND